MAVMCLTACKKDENEESISQRTSRTVLIYMSGENNLTVENSIRYLNYDLEEIIEGSKQLSNDQRLLVFVDSLNTNKQQSGKPYIIEVHGGKVYERYQFDHDFYASDPAYFKQVLQWTINNAPADSYGLVLWGHACGWTIAQDAIEARTAGTRAYGLDYGTDFSYGNGQKWMNITQMAKALSGLPKLEFVFADCCNMMCAEIGYALKDATNYLIGSPAEIPGEGAPYHLIIPSFFKQGSELYKGIIDTYFDYYDEYDINTVPLSVIDTRHIEALAQKTHDVLDRLAEPYPVYPQYPNLVGDSIMFYWYYDAPIMFDMRSFVKTYAPNDVFQQWDATYQQAVPHYRTTLQWETIYSNLQASFRKFSKDASKNGCVSMFIPRNSSAYFDGIFHYNLTYHEYAWNRVIDWSRFGWDESITDYRAAAREQ